MNIIKSHFKWNGQLKDRISTDYFIVHHAKAKNCNVSDIHKWHQDRGWIGIGYNLFIAKNGRVYEGRPINSQTAAAKGYNSNSVHVCLEGDFEVENITDEQYTSLVNSKVYCDEYFKTNLKPLRHKDVNHTTCPANIPWIHILADFENKKRELKKQKEESKFATAEEVESLRKEITRMKKYLEDFYNVRIR